MARIAAKAPGLSHRSSTTELQCQLSQSLYNHVQDILVSQARPTFAKKREGSGELRRVPLHYYGAIQSHCSILSHDRLHHHLSGNNGLVNGDRELGHLFLRQRARTSFLATES